VGEEEGQEAEEEEEAEEAEESSLPSPPPSTVAKPKKPEPTSTKGMLPESHVIGWKVSYLAFLRSQHERLGADSPASTVNQYLHREIAELLRVSGNRWRPKPDWIELSEDGLTVKSLKDCHNHVVTTEKPYMPGVVTAWRLKIVSMSNSGTMRYHGVTQTESNDRGGPPFKGDWTVQIINGYLHGTGSVGKASSDEDSGVEHRCDCRATDGDTVTFVLDRR
jgi:hypothetical protein